MKKNFLIFLSLIILIQLSLIILIQAQKVQAQEVQDQEVQDQEVQDQEVQPVQPVQQGQGFAPQNIACTVLAWFCQALLVLAFIIVVVSGYQIATSGGDPQRVADAKRNLMFALIATAAIYNLGNIIKLFNVQLPCTNIPLCSMS